MDIEKVKEIIDRKSSIPLENETFEDISEAYKHCPDCGQALIWKVVE